MEENVFTRIKNLKQELASKGMDVYDFSIGSPGTRPARQWLEILSKEVMDDGAYGYPVKETSGMLRALSDWYKRCHHVDVIPEKESMGLLGSHDALVHLCLAFTDPGDTVIVPDPCYPAYMAGVQVSRTNPYFLPVYKKGTVDAGDYFSSIPTDVATKARIIFVNYPQNPTTLTADDSFYEALIGFARKYDIMVVSDSAYLDLIFDGEKAESFLSYEGAKEVGIELTSLSKSHGAAGIRVGFAAGNSSIIERFRDFKSNMDYNIFLPIQRMAEKILDSGDSIVDENRAIYQRKRDIMINGMDEAGWKGTVSHGTVFLWAPVPGKYQGDDERFCNDLAMECGILVTPGSAFGDAGKGFVRLAMVMEDEELKKACEAMKRKTIFEN